MDLKQGVNRRTVLNLLAPGAAALSVARGGQAPAVPRTDGRPNVLFIMTDQQRFDTIAALGNPHIYTPNFDRLVRRGVTFTNAYSTCPVCVPARYTIRTGCEPPTTRRLLERRPPTRRRARPRRWRSAAARTWRGRCAAWATARSASASSTPARGTRTWASTCTCTARSCTARPSSARRDAYAAFIAREHPEYDFIEALMGERTEMYYMPQMSPLPAELTRRALGRRPRRRADRAPTTAGPTSASSRSSARTRRSRRRSRSTACTTPTACRTPSAATSTTDHMDEQIPWMNHAIWAEDINDSHARVLKARYYGEISYIDHCLGRILDAVEARGDADNTLICFFADHGDHLGDHHAWQKESFFEASCHIPFLVSWPARLPRATRREELVCLTDLFGIATTRRRQTASCARAATCWACWQGSAQPRRARCSAITACPARPRSRSWCARATGSTSTWPTAGASSSSIWATTRTNSRNLSRRPGRCEARTARRRRRPPATGRNFAPRWMAAACAPFRFAPVPRSASTSSTGRAA